jgi:hypothetical protein
MLFLPVSVIMDLGDPRRAENTLSEVAGLLACVLATVA